MLSHSAGWRGDIGPSTDAELYEGFFADLPPALAGAFLAAPAGLAFDADLPPALHQLCGAGAMPAASSITWPARSTVSSSNALPMICSPSGSPVLDDPAGTTMPGRPAMLTVTVKMSLRYISSGS